MRFGLWATMGGALLTAAILYAQGGQSPDDAAIRKQIDQFTASWNKGDTKATAQFFTDDGDYASSTGQQVEGRAEIEKALAAQDSAVYRGSTLTNTVTSIRFLKPDVANVNGTFEVSGMQGPDGKALPVRKGLWTIVAVKQGDKWLYASLRRMVPLRSPVAETAMDLTSPQIETFLHALAFIGGGAAFVIGLLQYRKAQAWKRYEFVAAEARQFDTDPHVRNAKLMIDWGIREIELFPDNPDYNARFVLITRPILHTALTTHDKIGRSYTSQEAAIRDCFDDFFGGLERFEEFIQGGLVKSQEVGPYLDYWMRSICVEANPELRRVLNEYVVFYHFTGVGNLFRRYGWQFGEGVSPSPRDRERIEKEYELVYK